MSKGNRMASRMGFHIVSLFPAFFNGPFTTGILGRAIRERMIDVKIHPLTEFKETAHKRVDDVPYGGGPGMVIRPEIMARAIESIIKEPAYLDTGIPIRIVNFSPRGRRFTQAVAERTAATPGPVILLCGRYEGIDQRVLDMYVTEEYRVGEAVVSGGEFPALIFLDAVSRLIPGVLGNEHSIEEESFSRNLGRRSAEYPCFTRPEEWRGIPVPKVLVSGNHKTIREWRKANCARPGRGGKRTKLDNQG